MADPNMSDLPARVAVLEQIARNTEQILAEIRVDIRELRAEVSTLRREMHTMFYRFLTLWLAGLGALVGAMAHGFHWL